MQDASPSLPPQLGSKAPNFRARTTQGMMTLGDYRGRWIVLFSHPADFTPVCTSEFVAFAQAQGDFDALGCQLLGLSVDSLPSHLAWLDAIRRELNVTIGFPVIEDPSMTIARAYGMLDQTAENSSTVRSTFIIDPEGIVQAILTYPLSVGRSVSEIMRTLKALQRTAKGGALTPEGWQPGQAVFDPASLTTESVSEQNSPLWFYRLREDEA
ncbi:peroxiredoxin [Asaia spathodeae]|uniref:Alkyl hydroperoxide reductase C n=1 Tax=Asaia spathodeae TaxID=657016 RepID=A0ABX2P1N9_9PROT|nr:peroxiredoxin [Asaia spathodeae]